MRKFINRNRAGVLAASAVAVALLLGVIGTSFGMWSAKKAEAESRKNEQLANEATTLAETIKIQKRVLGEGDEDTLKSMANLGVIVTKQGRLADSKKLMQETLEISLRELGEDSMPARVMMLNLACNEFLTGQLDKAELLFKKLVEIHTRVLGQDSPETLNIVLNLASTYQVQNRHNEVLELLKPRLPLFRSVLGKDEEKSTMLLDILAKSYVGANEIDEARSLCQEMLESLDSELAGSDASLSSLYSAATVLTYEEIPEVWDPTRALGYAERLCEKAKSLGFTLWLQDYQNVLALAQYQTGDTAAAIESQRRAISLLRPNASERSQFEKRLAEYEAALADSDKESPSEATADDAKADGQK